MGYLYSTISPFYNTMTMTFSTAHINMYPTATGVVYDNNAFNDLPGDEKHYLISSSELKELGIFEHKYEFRTTWKLSKLDKSKLKSFGKYNIEKRA